MDLSVLIVNWKSGRHLAALLDSLEPLAHELREVVIVDNASGEEAPANLRDIPCAIWIQADHNLGFAGAANLGMARTGASFVLLLNPDVKLIAESVRSLYRHLLQIPEAVLISGPLRGPDGLPQDFQLRPLPTPWSVLLEVLFLKKRQSKSKGQQQIGPREVEQPAAAYWLVRKAAWEMLGGMDERFHPAWFEDVDFCRRARGAGWRIYFDPGAPADHRGAASLEHLDRTTFLSIYYRNLLKYLRKHHPWAHPWLWLPVQAGKLLRMVINPGS